MKRKRAQLKREAVQNSSGSPTDGNQQPNLNEVSRDLPSGWQVSNLLQYKKVSLFNISQYRMVI